MYSFCEECGNKLSGDDKFCDQCGAKVDRSENSNTPDFKNNFAFTNSFFYDGKTGSLSNEDYYYGIVLTNFSKFKILLGNEGLALLKNNLQKYLDGLLKIGVCYLVLDVTDNCLKKLQDNNWKKHINLLRKASQKIKREFKENLQFIMLLGGNDIIPVPVFANPNPTGNDHVVESDLPYATLSIEDPQESAEARNPVIAVGRIATGTDTTASDIMNLLQNTLTGLGDFALQRTFGLSAHCWQEVSAFINNKVCKEDLFVSPALIIDNLPEYYSVKTNIHYFNLHGSDQSADWYGQKGENYPIAFAPRIMAQSKSLNIVGVEACYGARFIDLKKEESILLTALSAKTVSFVGSSRIAWGPSAPPMDLADIVIHDYLALIQQGMPAGVAFLDARIHAFENSLDKDPATGLLTLLEFNLFGDPVFFITTDSVANNATKKLHTKQKGLDGDLIEELSEDKLISTTVSNPKSNSLYNMVRGLVDSTQSRITQKINKDVWAKYPEFKNIEPIFSKFKFLGKEYNRFTYKKDLKYFDKYLLINTNEKGDILAEVSSK